jgi:hypothetical protein
VLVGALALDGVPVGATVGTAEAATVGCGCAVGASVAVGCGSAVSIAVAIAVTANGALVNTMAVGVLFARLPGVSLATGVGAFTPTDNGNKLQLVVNNPTAKLSFKILESNGRITQTPLLTFTRTVYRLRIRV